jgi:FlaA1/EpsC-like NDP-sugar epimerase
VKDSTLRDYILHYIADSSELMASLNTHLHQSLQDCAEVILWGSGQLAMKLLRQEPLRTAKIVACVDSNPINQGKKLNGIPILAPTELNGLDCPIVIATTLHDSAIRSDIHKLGIPNRLISLRQPGNDRGASL